MRQRDRQRGFTLVELMIVVAIVAILAAVAYPSYTESVLEGRRAEARTALAELLQQQERYMTQRNAYAEFGNVNGVTSPDPSMANTFKVYSGSSNASPAYWLKADKCPNGSGGQLSIADCVMLTATPTQTDARVGTLSLLSTGVKLCSGQTAGTTGFKACWP